MVWSESPKVVAARRRSPVVDVLVETLDGWRLHQSGRNASLLSFWGFLSIFPLLLVATTIVGLVLEGNEELQEDIIDSALADIPVLGAELARDPASIEGSVPALILGLALALWSGLRVFAGAQVAFDDTWEIPIDDRHPMPMQRVRGLLALLTIAGAHILTLMVSALVHTAGLPEIGRIVLILTTVAIHIGVIAVLFRYLTSADPSWGQVWPGAVVAGIGYGVLQHYATALVGRITENASDTYGQFALVLGLVTWLGFLSILTLMSMELNAALVLGIVTWMGFLSITALMANEYNAARVKLRGSGAAAAVATG